MAGGGEASAIYEQFAHTPLKIRPTQRRHDADASGAVVAATAELQDKSLASVTVKLSFSSPSGPSPPPPLSPTRTQTRKVEQQSGRARARQKSTGAVASPLDNDGDLLMKKEKKRATRAHKTSVSTAIAAIDALRNGKEQSTRKRKDWERDTETKPAAEETVATNKRIARSVLPKTNRITITIPSKKAHPVKRHRIMGAKAKSIPPVSAASLPGETLPAMGEVTPTKENRSLLASFIHCIGDDKKELSTPQKIPISTKKRAVRQSRNPATPKARRSQRIQLSLPDAEVPADYITDACDELLSTSTISGALFAVALNSLRSLQEEFLQVQLNESTSDAIANPFQSVSSLCMEIAACEQRAEAHNESSVKSSLLSRRRGSKSTTSKKCVRFQSFDLSCLNLHYVGNRHTEALVDMTLLSYDEIMSHIAPMLQPHAPGSSKSHMFEIRMFRELVRVLNDNSMLFVNPDTLATEAERIYLAAFGSRDPHAQHEIQASRSYYAKEFKKLVIADGSTVQGASFLEDMFSSLVSSSMRYKLRALFLEYDSDKVGGDKPSVSMATYTHQDFGSAVHCALQESLLYEPLTTPVVALLNEKSELMTYLDKAATDDFEHIEQFILARRFLRYHVKKAYEAPSPDGFASATWANIERICGIAKRYNFEDEAHFFPLASIKDFVIELEAQEPDLLQLEAGLSDFYDQKKVQSFKEQSEPCLECGEIVTRQEASGFIVCTTCAGNFHLKCLHLPPSFAQFAGQYTCPSCFLGRRR